jgi:hypothetical protein
VQRRAAPWFTSRICTCFTALAASTHQVTLTSSSPRGGDGGVALPMADRRHAGSPQADGDTLQTSLRARSCSRNHSAGGSATGSLDQAVSWFMRLLTAQV